ncbi:helix-turn-helix domain-containing protein [Fulvivirgaceae bacterium BMA10]|uniref:Helix-turn-helix domain-containing protein n=1 Tax=Splendidivirga corallicola TaxID=3051826 RepID=A0ABT8KU10_9BACT|nr:helix-turn-helix domain-containing protein [Fulvivirgaceae bacterium BMA10]
MQNTSTSALNVVQDGSSASALLNPMRIKILSHLKEPNSASGLSRVMDVPRQKLNYHLRELEKKGFVEFVESKKRGNCVERIVRATAKTYLINFDAFGNMPTDPADIQDKFSSTYLIAVASQSIQEVAKMQNAAQKAKKKLSTFTLQTEICFESPKDLHGFTEELSQAVANLAAKYQCEGKGRSYKFYLGSYPAPKKDKRKTST